MKKWILFIGGVVTGVILTLLVAFIFTYSSKTDPSGVKNFEYVGDVIDEPTVQVFQVIGDNAALVNGGAVGVLYLGPVYLLRNYDGKYYYDDQIVKKPKGKEFRQTGIYRYETKSGYKTVPIIELK